ncbi:MAG: hypothetical protein L6Q74_08230 [Sphaerotilus natans subsp. sulfidivorans]|uniref:hypothetical protein n=1 Tax=Sphaerotilus sulfidivorans TaxID=639200 RepID=UPI0023540C47|nr:hypothetical protein [Sphaerotilus sulfidivorans]MCK6401881.1 hypothetical protein [Sphaerotilus sulfidivorans]
MNTSKRVNNLKTEIIKELPLLPNTRETKHEIESKDLSEILIHYLHWKARLVPTRRRSVHISPEITSDYRWKKFGPFIRKILQKIRDGEDINGYLSHKVHSDGYISTKKSEQQKHNSWEHKDQLLNTKGLYHLHMNPVPQKLGDPKRFNELLLAHISREKFHAICISDHSVFANTDDNGELSAERLRMWDIHKKHETQGMKPGTIYISHPIASSGHPIYIIEMARKYYSTIFEIDEMLDDRKFIENLYQQGNMDAPRKYNFQWKINDLDLCLYEKRAQIMFLIHSGHI